jgi:hypothetical protein
MLALQPTGRSLDGNLDATPFSSSKSGGGAGNRRMRRSGHVPASGGITGQPIAAADPPRCPAIPEDAARPCAHQERLAPSTLASEFLTAVGAGDDRAAELATSLAKAVLDASGAASRVHPSVSLATGASSPRRPTYSKLEASCGAVSSSGTRPRPAGCWRVGERLGSLPSMTTGRARPSDGVWPRASAPKSCSTRWRAPGRDRTPRVGLASFPHSLSSPRAPTT